MMLSYYSRRKIQFPLYGLLAVLIIVFAVLATYNWPVALAGFIISGGCFFC